MNLFKVNSILYFILLLSNGSAQYSLSGIVTEKESHKAINWCFY
jgi:hypothetical protein